MAVDFLELDMSEGLEASAADRAAYIQNMEERMMKFMTFLSYRPSKRRYIIEESGAQSTSDFPILFGTILDRQLLAKYTLQTPPWRSYVKTGTQRDFRVANILGVFGLQGSLQAVPELAEYKADKLIEGRVPNQVRKYGKLFPISWETLINDDLGAFADVAARLAQSALQTEYREVSKLFVGAAGPNTAVFGTSITAIDGVSVNNKGTQPLTADNLFATSVLMAQQLDVDGNPLMIEGFTLVVPPQKQKAALEAVSPAALIALTGSGTGAAGTRATSMNVTASLNIDIIVNPYLPVIDLVTGTTAWYLFAKLSNGAAVQMNFLSGHETPEIVMKSSNKVAIGGGIVSPMEGSFEQDSMQWRVRHILGGAVVDVRMAYAQAATT